MNFLSTCKVVISIACATLLLGFACTILGTSLNYDYFTGDSEGSAARQQSSGGEGNASMHGKRALCAEFIL